MRRLRHELERILALLDVVFEALEPDEHYGQVVQRVIASCRVQNLICDQPTDLMDRQRTVLIFLASLSCGDVPDDLIYFFVFETIKDTV